MIQEMMAGYWESLLIGYAKAGIIGWIVWFVVAFVYVISSFGLNLELYQVDEKGGGKWTLWGILRVVIWPYGMLYDMSQVISYVDKKIKERSK